MNKKLNEKAVRLEPCVLRLEALNGEKCPGGGRTPLPLGGRKRPAGGGILQVSHASSDLESGGVQGKKKKRRGWPRQ